MYYYDEQAEQFKARYQGEKLSRLRAKNGGSILDQLRKTAASDIPTLVIGLGGLGCRTINQVKKKYIQYINDPSGMIQFLAMDFDESSKSQLSKYNHEKGADGYLEDDESCNMLADLSVTANLVPRLLVDKIDDPAQKWVDKNLDRGFVIKKDGAKGVRQIGRLILSRKSNYETALSRLKTKFSALQTACGGGNELTVILVAGISGGTGSGTIIDIAYMIRLAVLQTFGRTSTEAMQFDAILYTPEVQFRIPSVDQSLLSRNFAAAMKEINAFFKQKSIKMNYSFPREGNPEGKLIYGGFNVGSLDIFKSVTLVQGYSAAGGTLEEDSCIETVSNYVINAIGEFDATQIGQNGMMQALNSIMCNEQGNAGTPLNTMLNNHPAIPRDTLYRYRAIGFRTLHFPVEELMTYIANETLLRLDERFMRDDLLFSPEEICYRAGILNGREEQGAVQYAPPEYSYENMFRMSGITDDAADRAVPDIQSTVDIFEKTWQDHLSGISYLLPNTADKRWAENARNFIRERIQEEMRAHGPFAALRLSQRTLRLLEQIRDAANAVGNLYTKHPEECFDAVYNAAKKQHDEFSSMGSIARAKESLVKSSVKSRQTGAKFKQALQKVWEVRSKLNILETLQAAVDEIRVELQKEHNSSYEYFTGAYGAIAQIISQDSTASIETAERVQADVTSFHAEMLNLTEVNQHDRILGKFVSYWLTDEYIDNLCNNLIDAMLNNPTAWSPEGGNFCGVEELRTLFKNQFSAFSQDMVQKLAVIQNTSLPEGITIEMLLDVMKNTLDAPGQSVANRWASFEQVCMTQLHMPKSPVDIAAEEIFKQATAIGRCATIAALGGAGVDFSDLYEYKLLCLMDSMPYINIKIKALSNADDPRRQVAEGNFPGIFNLVVNCFAPLYFFNGMLDNQERYTNALHIGTNVNAGMHMDASETSDWREFPPLVNNQSIRQIFAATQVTYTERSDYSDEDTIFEHIKRKADRAVKEGLVTAIDPNSPKDSQNRLMIFPDGDPGEVFLTFRDDLIAEYGELLKDAYVQMQDIDRASTRPEADWQADFSAHFTEPAVWALLFTVCQKRLLASMKQANADANDISTVEGLTPDTAVFSKVFWGQMESRGIKLRFIEAEARDDYNQLEMTGLGDFHDPAQGGFYRIVRRSLTFRQHLNRMDSLIGLIRAELDKKRETENAARREEKLTAFRKASASLMTELFLECVLAKHLQIERTDLAISGAFYPDRESASAPHLLIKADNGAKDRPLVSLRSYEKQYYIYGLYTEFAEYIANMKQRDAEEAKRAEEQRRIYHPWYENFCGQLKRELDDDRQAVIEGREEPTDYAGVLEALMDGVSFPNDGYRVQTLGMELDDAYRTEPPKYFTHLKDTSFTDPICGDGFAGQVKAFYDQLSRYFTKTYLN